MAVVSCWLVGEETVRPTGDPALTALPLRAVSGGSAAREKVQVPRLAPHEPTPPPTRTGSPRTSAPAAAPAALHRRGERHHLEIVTC